MRFNISKTFIVGSVTCNQPEVPRDATSEVLKDTYSVDETVEFTCETNSFEKQTATCLTDGSWSNSGFTCGSEFALYHFHLEI